MHAHCLNVTSICGVRDAVQYPIYLSVLSPLQCDDDVSANLLALPLPGHLMAKAETCMVMPSISVLGIPGEPVDGSH